MTTTSDASALDLAGKVAVVVGGTQNMGIAFAENFALRGASVLATYAHDEEAAEAASVALARAATAAGSASTVVRADATLQSDVQGVFAHAAEEFGRVDIVIHVPGTIRKTTIAEASEDDYDAVFDLNTRSAFHTLREASNRVEDNGRILALSTSLTGLPLPLYGLYSASKAAVETMVKGLSKEVGTRGVTANIVAPGPIDTRFFFGPESEESVQYVLGNLSMAHRLGAVDDVTPVVGFLVSEEARWITGQVIRVNNGMV